MSTLVDKNILPANFADGQILYGEDLNNIIRVLREGVNVNWVFNQATLTGTSNGIYAESVIQLQEHIPNDGAYGYVVDVERDEEGNTTAINSLELYKFKDGVWKSLGELSITRLLESYKRLSTEGKIVSSITYSGQPVYLTGVSSETTFSLASALFEQTSQSVYVLSSSLSNGILPANTVGEFSVFGDVHVFDISRVLDSSFLMNAGVLDYIDILPGTKLYLSKEYGKYSFVEPTKPAQSIWVATIIKVLPNNSASIFVNPQHLRLSGGNTTYLQQDEPSTAIEGDIWFDNNL